MGEITLRVNDLLKGRELREGRRLALADVARDSGIAIETLAELVAARAESISLPVLAKLCSYFDCTPDNVLHFDADPETLDEDEMESRDIVARWEDVYGADEHPPQS